MLADIGREAGIAPATLLQRFGSKRGLLLAVAAFAPGIHLATGRNGQVAEGAA